MALPLPGIHTPPLPAIPQHAVTSRSFEGFIVATRKLFWTTATRAFVLVQQRRQARHHLRFRQPQVIVFARIVVEIVQLPACLAGFGSDVSRIAETVRASRHRQLPRPLTNTERAISGMMHDGLADRLRELIAAQGRQEVVTILASIGRQRDADHGRDGGQEIGETNQFLARAAGRDVTGPADQKRYAMAAIPDIRLLPAQAVVGPMVPFLDVLRQPMSAIITREYQ